jgi:predicted metal-binding protein
VSPQTPTTPLRFYPSHWKGQVLLVCRKCERKLKHSDAKPLKIKKSLKKLAKEDPNPTLLHVISVGCMDLCPKDAVTVCTQAQLAQTPPGLTIVRNAEDIAELYRQSKL